MGVNWGARAAPIVEDEEPDICDLGASEALDEVAREMTMVCYLVLLTAGVGAALLGLLLLWLVGAL